MPLEAITSPNNTRLKLVRNLINYTKRRRSEGRLVLEGIRLIEDALQSGGKSDFILLRDDISTEDDSIQYILQQAQQTSTPVYQVEAALFDEAADTETSQGILGVFITPILPLPDDITLLIVLDRLSDPGNLGTIIRGAAAAGADGIILTPGSVDPTNPKVIRAAMGAHFRIPIQRWDWQQITALELPIYAADASTNTSLYDVDWREPAIIIIGGEAHGLSQDATRHATTHIRIPMQSGESLNAAMASTVILYEILRQRENNVRG